MRMSCWLSARQAVEGADSTATNSRALSRKEGTMVAREVAFSAEGLVSC